MFSIGLSEILLVAIVGCIVTDPKKLPGLISTARVYYKKFNEVRAEVLASFREICENDDEKLDDSPPPKGKRRIVGDDGAVYEAYEISDLVHVSSNRKKTTMSDNCITTFGNKKQNDGEKSQKDAHNKD